MSKKNRNLAQYFGNDNNKKELNIDNPIENNSDILSDIASGKGSREDTRKFKGYYLEHEVANAIDRDINARFGNKIPKGAKSDYVNELIKRGLKEEGLL